MTARDEGGGNTHLMRGRCLRAPTKAASETAAVTLPRTCPNHSSCSRTSPSPVCSPPSGPPWPASAGP
eukprot:2867112-Pyramimonas_sp.AAC.1